MAARNVATRTVSAEAHQDRVSEWRPSGLAFAVVGMPGASVNPARNARSRSPTRSPRCAKHDVQRSGRESARPLASPAKQRSVLDIVVLSRLVHPVAWAASIDALPSRWKQQFQDAWLDVDGL
jgi:hypothetical protein